ncbi:hypothetical protein [Streptomyces sp. NPDC048191]|uniref:hypothetical protein n=1 Tax=Streptomyces sp. NPDC048191 TaxID=3155484 RepID=UPI0033D943AB
MIAIAHKAMEGTDTEDAELLTDPVGSLAAQGDVTGGRPGAQVISLHARRLPPDQRTTLPDMSKYDRLLTPVTTSKTRKGHGA